MALLIFPNAEGTCFMVGVDESLPSAGLQNGFAFLDITNGRVYQRTAGVWVEKLNAAYVLSGQTEIDFGTTPVSEATFIVTDTAVTTLSQIVAQLAWQAPTGKEIDEIEMDDLSIRCQPSTGQFSMFIRASDGSYLADKFKINYLVG